MPLHRLLQRQLRRWPGDADDLPPHVHDLLETVSEAYKGYEQHITMLERSLELSSGELLEANSELRAVLNAFPDLLMRLDADGRILDAKGRGLDELDFALSDLIGQTLETSPLKSATGAVGEALNESLEERATVCVEFTMEVEESTRYFEGRLLPYRNRQLIFVVRDITDRKHAELELAATHRQLLEMAHQAGMAEVAVDVLHNIGNALNSVAVSVSTIKDIVRKSRVGRLQKLASLIDDRADDLGRFLTEDPRGALIPRYIKQIAGALETERETITEEIDELQASTTLVAEIIQAQQTCARVSGLTERITADALVEESLRLHISSIRCHNIKLIRDYRARPSLIIDKSKGIQILANLISNAVHAVTEDAPGSAGEITVFVDENPEAGEVVIAVRDDGVGICEENLSRIFQFGFTTRESGHGFGLHSAANLAGEMQGSLTAHSSGEGCGTTFTLRLPRERGDKQPAPSSPGYGFRSEPGGQTAA